MRWDQSTWLLMGQSAKSCILCRYKLEWWPIKPFTNGASPKQMGPPISKLSEVRSFGQPEVMKEVTYKFENHTSKHSLYPSCKRVVIFCCLNVDHIAFLEERTIESWGIICLGQNIQKFDLSLYPPDVFLKNNDWAKIFCLSIWNIG